MPEVEGSARSLDPRYAVYGEIASGGMASVQYGRLLGPRGFSRAVAIKRLHAHFAREPEFVTMFVDEARLSARLVHANIIHTLDVIETPGEVALVMEYVHGETLWNLLRLARAEQKLIPLPVGCSLLASVLYGLHAAHEAAGDNGEPLCIVHRDVSPQNILIGADGIPRVLDFGIAKALGRLRSTPRGEIKGKLGYISCEQLRGEAVDRRTDIYGASAVFWEVLTGRVLFDGPSEPAVVHRVLYDSVAPPSSFRPELPATLDAIVLRGLSRERELRFASAREMALAIEREVGLASQSEVEAWLRELAGDRLDERGRVLAALQDVPEPSVMPIAPASSTRRIERTALRDSPELESSAPRSVRRRGPRRALGSLIVAAGVAAGVLGLREATARPNAKPEKIAARESAAIIRSSPSPEAKPERIAARKSGEAVAASSSPDAQPDKPIAARDKSDFLSPGLSPGAKPERPSASLRSATRAVEGPLPLGPVPDSAADGNRRSQLQATAAAASEPPLESASSKRKRDKSAPSARAGRLRPSRERSASDGAAPATPGSPESCALFYYIDGKGIRRPKPECL